MRTTIDGLVALALRRPFSHSDANANAVVAPTISILVLSMRRRHVFLMRLLDRLTPQLTADAEILVSIDDATVAIGTKRNQLLDAARGSYLCFVDDDDLVAPNYVEAIVEALRSKPDAVGFQARRYRDGREDGIIDYSMKYTQYELIRGIDGEDRYTKPPTHLCPVRSDLARAVRFAAVNEGEDVDYAMRLRPLLTVETYVNQQLYEYHYISPGLRHF